MRKIFLLFLIFIFSIYADTIKGIVVDSQEKPISDVEVKLKAISPLTEKDSKITKTNQKGEFIFENLKTGYYVLEAKKENFIHLGKGRIEVNEAKYGIKNYKIVLKKPGSISGYIYDEENKPVSGAKVGNYSNFVYSNKNGFYRIKGIPPGENFLMCEKDGFVKVAKHEIKVEEGKETGGINFILQFAGSIKGKILDENNNPVKNAYVYTYESPYYSSSKTDEKGEFIIKNLPSGNYKISVSAIGYEWGCAGNIEVKKKETTDIPPVHLKLRPKSFHFYTRTRNFLPTENITFYYNSFRVPKFKLFIYQIEFLNELNKIPYYIGNPISYFEDTFNIEKSEPILIKEFKIDYPTPLTEVYNKKFEIGKLPLGVYLIVVQPEELNLQKKLIIVSDIGIVVKQVENQNYFFITDLISGKPLSGLKVYFPEIDYNLRRLKFEKYKETDENGIVKTDFTIKYVFCMKDKSIGFLEIFDTSSYYKKAFMPNKETVYIYTDRPVYRPAQEVFFKGILRKEEGDYYSVLKIDKVGIQINDPNGNMVYSEELKVKDGSFSGKFTIPEEPPLGIYNISVYQDNSNLGSISFKVLEYRKPEYFVEVISDKERYLPKEKPKILVKAKYYFGSPVKNADISYTLYENIVWDYDEFEYDEEYEGNYGYHQYVLSGNLKTDEKGEALIEIPLKNAYEYETRYTVEVNVADISRREVKGETSFIAIPGNFKIKISTSKYLYTPEESIPIEIIAEDYEGKSLENKSINLSVSIEEYKNRKYIYKTLLTETLKTDKKGKIQINIKPKVLGYIKISAFSLDEFNNLITANKYIWIAGENYPFSYSKKELELITDKKSYNIGETAKILINSSISDLNLFLTIESFKIHDSKFIKMQGNSVLIEIPVKKEYLPNFYISVFSVKNKRFYEITKNIKVSNEEKLLKVEIIPDKDKYLPGEEIIYKIKTT
ncbi:MAG: carboxypeptidase regulatory-like domain-containing protein, partial [bacterium]|nr:carboxypeptidase regulatory-like domain-containing protein [bacterium]